MHYPSRFNQGYQNIWGDVFLQKPVSKCIKSPALGWHLDNIIRSKKSSTVLDSGQCVCKVDRDFSYLKYFLLCIIYLIQI